MVVCVTSLHDSKGKEFGEGINNNILVLIVNWFPKVRPVPKMKSIKQSVLAEKGSESGDINKF